MNHTASEDLPGRRARAATATGVEPGVWTEISSIIEADASDRQELAARYAIITIASVSLYFTTWDAIFLIWNGSYLVLNSCYVWFLRRLKPPGTTGLWRCIIAQNIVCSALYLVLPLYLWTSEIPSLRAVALAAIAGHAMFNLSRHNRRSVIAIWDSISVGGAIFFLGAYQASFFIYASHQILVVLCTIAVVFYYLFAIWTSIRMQENLTQARAEAFQIQKMDVIGQLTSGVAHDFNNLLTVIRGNIELAEVAQTPKDQEQALRDAREAADRAATLTAQLLSFSRRARLTSDTFQAAEFATSIERILSRLIPASIALQIEHAPDLDTIHCDRNQLENALINLAINARDAMESKGALTINISPVRRATNFHFGGQNLRAGFYARIRVRDTGPGIPDALLSQVTEPFFTTKGPGEGSGLGLSSATGFVEQSNGALEIESSTAGTCVTLLLPTSDG